jgi:hypothetical protein
VRTSNEQARSRRFYSVPSPRMFIVGSRAEVAPAPQRPIYAPRQTSSEPDIVGRSAVPYSATRSTSTLDQPSGCRAAIRMEGSVN